MAAQEQAERGILYVAKGEEFVEEATLSARRVKSVMPDCPITLVSNQEVEADCFDDHLLDEGPFELRDKPRALQRTPYRRTLYLDTDIFLERPVWELFDVLDQFDVALRQNRDLAHIPGDRDSSFDGVPPGVPEFNGGLILYRKSPDVLEMLGDWEERCLPEHDFDQRTLRPALYHSDVRVCPLENRYNCMYRYDNVVDGEVKVFHGRLLEREGGQGRGRTDLRRVREKLNETDKFRIHRTYMNTLLVDPPLPVTTRARIALHHAIGLVDEIGVSGTVRRTLRWLFSRKG